VKRESISLSLSLSPSHTNTNTHILVRLASLDSLDTHTHTHTHRYYKGLGSIFGGLFSQVYRTKSSVQTGRLKSTFTSLSNSGWFDEFMMSKKNIQRKYVTADDPDIEKAVLYEGQRVNPKTGLPSMELKKIVLAHHQKIEFRKDEIFLLEDDNDRFFRLPQIKESDLPIPMKGKIPSLEDWYKAIMRHRHRDHLHGDCVLVKLHSAKGLPTVSSKFETLLKISNRINPRCKIRVIDTSGDDAVPSRMSSEKHSRNPVWNEEFALGPVDISAQVLVIEIHSNDDYVGEVTFPLMQFRKSEDQEFNIPLQDVDNKCSVNVSGYLRFKARIITSLL